jgi:hypothetical protein
MTAVEVPLLEIAREYPDAAIEFFLERTKFFCAIHLAGAAGELFDGHLQESEQFFTAAWKAEKALMSKTGPVPTDEAADKAADQYCGTRRRRAWPPPRGIMEYRACGSFTPA